MSAYAPPYIPVGPMNNSSTSNSNNNMVLMSAQAAAHDKIMRELFVGNTPPGTTELLLLHFLNAAMRRVNLCGPMESPILNCRLNQKFAFIELATAVQANVAMQMNGIPFLGAVLKISRPSKYNGPPEQRHATRNWSDLTGQSSTLLLLPHGGVATGALGLDPDMEKMSRELFIGNTTPEMTEAVLREFLGNALQQVGLTVTPGNPIVACRVSGKFAFVELRSAQEATKALNLNNIPFMGVALRVGRPSKWTGPHDVHGNWEDILAKFMAGEIGPPGSGTTTTATASNSTASRVVVLENMLTDQDLANPDEYQDIMDDTREECSQFGKLQQVIIPRAGEVGATKVFLEYTSEQDAAAAIQALEGRTFDGRQVSARYYDPVHFGNQNYGA